MVSFWVYDLSFLVLFSLGVFWFLRNRKDELSREGIIFMWRTQFGVKAIGKFVKKFGFILKRLRWLIVGTGFVLMGVMVWMLGRSASIYFLHPEITKIIKAPPIAPLIPYFPKLFGMESLFPDFYFTYFLLALAIVAISHEFSHGIFMKLFKVKIKSTGLVFLGPMLGAFVEQSEKSMNKKKKLDQMTILGAGVFANILMALLFYGLYVLFFFSSFTASGYAFDSYGALGDVPLSGLNNIGSDIGEMNVIFNGNLLTANFTEVDFYGRAYLMSEQTKDFILQGIALDNSTTVLFEASPALLAQMTGAIVEANGVKISNADSLREFLSDREPGDLVHFITDSKKGTSEYDIVLGEHPYLEGKAYLGVGHGAANYNGFIQKILGGVMSFKDSSTYYKPTWDGDFVYFIYYLLWWVMVINLLVALFNMLPLGMLDGGRFLYLGVWGITKNEKFAKWAYKFMTYFILFLFVAMMFFWFIGII